MLNIKELIAEWDQDFENLSETGMEWSINTWESHIVGGRFEGDWTFDHSYIYWFEGYASVVAAKTILKDLGHSFSVLYDTALEQWAITTTYVSLVWRA